MEEFKALRAGVAPEVQKELYGLMSSDPDHGTTETIRRDAEHRTADIEHDIEPWSAAKLALQLEADRCNLKLLSPRFRRPRKSFSNSCTSKDHFGSRGFLLTKVTQMNEEEFETSSLILPFLLGTKLSEMTTLKDFKALRASIS